MKPFKIHVLLKTTSKKLFLINKKGFTFFEIMVALSVIAIALTTVYKLHCQTISMNYSTIFYSVAPMLAQGKLSELEVLSTNDAISSDSGNFNHPFDSYTWSVDINEPDEIELEKVSKNLKKIDLTVYSENHQLAYQIQTYRLVTN